MKKIFYLAKIIFNIVEGNFYFPYLLTHSYNKAQWKLSFIILEKPPGFLQTFPLIFPRQKI